MVYGLWQSAAGLQVQEYRQAIIANNLANAETPGFKADRVAFVERLNASTSQGDLRTRHPVLDAMTGGLFETPVYTDFAQGGFIPSDNPLDVAVDGGGFLAVRTPDGVRYTRDGRLMMDRDGVLVQAASGAAVLDEDGQSIRLDRGVGSGEIKVDRLGRIHQGGALVGRLGLTDFADRRALEKTGQDLFSAERAQRQEASGTIRQHCFEASGVEPIAALVDLIAATRAYDTNARMITLQDESVGRMVGQLGVVG